MIKYAITVVDAGPMSQADKDTAVEAAEKTFSKYPAWLLSMAYMDDAEGLEEGVRHFEDGESLWAALMAQAEMDAWEAIGYQPVEGCHLEVEFWSDPS